MRVGGHGIAAWACQDSLPAEIKCWQRLLSPGIFKQNLKSFPLGLYPYPQEEPLGQSCRSDKALAFFLKVKRGLPRSREACTLPISWIQLSCPFQPRGRDTRALVPAKAINVGQGRAEESVWKGYRLSVCLFWLYPALLKHTDFL